MLSSWLIICHLIMDLLVRAAFKVVHLELATPSFLVCLFWVFLSDPKSNGETKRVCHLVISKCVKLVVRS